MRITTLNMLRCPAPSCGDSLEILDSRLSTSENTPDLMYGDIGCQRCKAKFPVLEGVAILIPDPNGLLHSQGKAIAPYLQAAYLTSEQRIIIKGSSGNTDNRRWGDLNSEQVTSWYLSTDYLSLDQGPWWVSDASQPSFLISSIMKDYWDDSPASRVERFLEENKVHLTSLLDLGCGAGGSLNRLSKFAERALGVDRSFFAVLKARQIVTGKAKSIKISSDLLNGGLSKEVPITRPTHNPSADFVVGDIFRPPVPKETWSMVQAFGVLDIVSNPPAFANLQTSLVAPNGLLVEGAPYQWSEEGARIMRSQIPDDIRTSRDATAWLYQREGLQIVSSADDVPWTVLKNARQLFLYSYHLLIAKKSDSIPSTSS